MRTFGKIWLGVSFIAIGIGIGILIIAFATGANWEKVADAANFTTMNQSYQGVESLDIDIKYGQVEIVEGDNFNISAENIVKGEVDSYVKNGTWYVRDKSRLKDLIGVDFNIEKYFYWDGENKFSPNITITLPKDFKANQYRLRVEAGTVEADVVNATECDLHVDAGTLTVNHLTAIEKSRFSVGVGEMNLENVKVNDMTLDCGVGDFEMSGKLTGDNDIKCGVGNIDLTIDGDRDDYNYDVQCGIGDVDIDGESYRNIGNNITKNNEAGNNLNLDCGLGDISVDFN